MAARDLVEARRRSVCRLNHRKVATRVGIITSLRHHKHVFADLDSAVAHARDHIARTAAAAAGNGGAG